jgi:hypothetical protein
MVLLLHFLILIFLDFLINQVIERFKRHLVHIDMAIRWHYKSTIRVPRMILPLGLLLSKSCVVSSF